MLEAALSSIKDTLDIVMWNINQEEYESPFSNTGNSFKCDTYEVHAYNWRWHEKLWELDDDGTPPPQPYNFKWRDLEVTWYKYFGRNTQTNRPIDNDEIEQMLDECIVATLALNEDGV